MRGKEVISVFVSSEGVGGEENAFNSGNTQRTTLRRKPA